MNRYFILILVFISCDLFGGRTASEAFGSDPYDRFDEGYFAYECPDRGTHIQFAMVMVDVKFDYTLTLK